MVTINQVSSIAELFGDLQSKCRPLISKLRSLWRVEDDVNLVKVIEKE